MKKIIIALIFMALVLPVFAQGNPRSNSDRLYYINVTVERIYPSREGFIIQYMQNSGSIGTVGIPNEWFSNAAGRAEITRLPRGTNWPTMTVFYVNGEFDHVRLYVHAFKGHQTWGSVPLTADVSRFFTDRESFNIQF
jgi:hypothetical protein